MTEHHVGGVRMKGRHEWPIDAGRSWRSVRTDPRRKREIISVTIRQVLLRAFLALVEGSVVNVGAVSFVQLRQALKADLWRCPRRYPTPSAVASSGICTLFSILARSSTYWTRPWPAARAMPCCSLPTARRLQPPR